ncbi:Cysteine hydrolase [Lobulomyces angularis]|nr:Cysteine hydrolase [Lobulomyces angularis]
MSNRLKFNPKEDALVIVDVQNDFIPGGSLAAADGDKILPKLFKFIEKAQSEKQQEIGIQRIIPVLLNKAGSVHCVRNTKGADFPPNFPEVETTIEKGTLQHLEAYSGFKGEEKDLNSILKKLKIKRVFIVGFCTEYCVKATAVDSLSNGFETLVITDLICPVNKLNEEVVFTEMKGCGLKLIESF